MLSQDILPTQRRGLSSDTLTGTHDKYFVECFAWKAFPEEAGEAKDIMYHYKPLVSAYIDICGAHILERRCGYAIQLIFMEHFRRKSAIVLPRKFKGACWKKSNVECCSGVAICSK